MSRSCNARIALKIASSTAPTNASVSRCSSSMSRSKCFDISLPSVLASQNQIVLLFLSKAKPVPKGIPFGSCPNCLAWRRLDFLVRTWVCGLAQPMSLRLLPGRLKLPSSYRFRWPNTLESREGLGEADGLDSRSRHGPEPLEFIKHNSAG